LSFASGERVFKTLPGSMKSKLMVVETKGLEYEAEGQMAEDQSRFEKDTRKKYDLLMKACEAYRQAAISRNDAGENLKRQAISKSEESISKRLQAKEERNRAAAASSPREKVTHSNQAALIDVDAEDLSKEAAVLFDKAAFEFRKAAEDFEMQSELLHEASKSAPDPSMRLKCENESIKVMVEAANERHKSGEMYQKAAEEPANVDAKTKHGQAAGQYERAAKDREEPIHNQSAIGGEHEKQKQEAARRDEETAAKTEKAKW
jgi:hypothetical protein